MAMEIVGIAAGTLVFGRLLYLGARLLTLGRDKAGIWYILGAWCVTQGDTARYHDRQLDKNIARIRKAKCLSTSFSVSPAPAPITLRSTSGDAKIFPGSFEPGTLLARLAIQMRLWKARTRRLLLPGNSTSRTESYASKDS